MRTRLTAALVGLLGLLTWLAGPARAASLPRLTTEIASQSGALGNRSGISEPRGGIKTSISHPRSQFGTGIKDSRGLDAARMGMARHIRRTEPYVAYMPSLSWLNAAAGISGGELPVIIGASALVIGLAVAASRRLSRRQAGASGRAGGRGAGSAPWPPTVELEARASQALVVTDDAVRTSQQELGFATARFGERATGPFSKALQSARAELAAAFKLRQLLDDQVPESEATRRQHLTDISARCAEASRLLDDPADTFDRLQDLEAREPELAAEVLAHATQQTARVEHSRQMIGQLAGKYGPGATTSVADSPDQALARLEFAADCLADARQAMAGNQTASAAVFLQAAESAADQASDLLDGVKHLEAELTQAASALPAALREIDADIAEGAAPLATRSDDDRASLVARAQEVADGVRRLLADGPFDALAALRSLEQADAALDERLAGAREERTRQERARAVLDQAMLVARSSVTAAEDFVTTRRGAVGAPARTRLAEAQRHFQQAIGSAVADPGAAVREAQRADALALDARLLAEQDADRFDSVLPALAGTGGFGGAILGGILIGSTLGGGRGDAGFAGDAEITGDAGIAATGGFAGVAAVTGDARFGSGRAGFGPGSFGGISTRGRNSIEGRSAVMSRTMSSTASLTASGSSPGPAIQDD